MKILMYGLAVLVVLCSTASHVHAATQGVSTSVTADIFSKAGTYIQENPGKTGIAVAATIFFISHFRNAGRISTLEEEIKKMQVMLDRLGVTDEIRRSMGK